MGEQHSQKPTAQKQTARGWARSRTVLAVVLTLAVAAPASAFWFFSRNERARGADTGTNGYFAKSWAGTVANWTLSRAGLAGRIRQNAAWAPLEPLSRKIPMTIDLTTAEVSPQVYDDRGVIVRHEAGKLFVTLAPGALRAEDVVRDAQPFTHLAIGGLAHDWREDAGAPRLPRWSLYVKLPPQADTGMAPQFNWDTEPGDVTEVGRVEPAPTTRLAQPSLGVATSEFALDLEVVRLNPADRAAAMARGERTLPPEAVFVESYEVSPEAYQATEDPAAHATFTRVSETAAFDLYRIDLYPVAYQPQAGVASVVSSIVAQVEVDPRFVAVGAAARAQRKQFRATALADCEANPADFDGVFLRPQYDGVKRVTAKALRDAGLSVSGINPNRLSVWRGLSQPIPSYIEDTDATFGNNDNDAIGFFVDELGAREKRGYYIRLDAPGAAGRMPVVDAPPGSGTGSILSERRRFITTRRLSNVDLYSVTATGSPPTETAIARTGVFWATNLGGENAKSRFYHTGAAAFTGLSGTTSIQNPARLAFGARDIDTASGEQATLRATLLSISETNDYNRVTITVNGTSLPPVDFQGANPTIDVSFPASLLRNTQTPPVLASKNSIFFTFEYPWIVANDYGVTSRATAVTFFIGDLEVGYPVSGTSPSPLDPRNFSISNFGAGEIGTFTINPAAVPLVLDVSRPLSPSILTPSLAGGVMNVATTNVTQMVVAAAMGVETMPVRLVDRSTNLRCLGGGADYIFVGPRDWKTQLDPLITRRKNDGYTTRFISTEDVTDQFAGGKFESGAMMAFLDDLTARYNPKPQFVTLVGTASFDPNRLNTGGDLGTYNDEWIPSVDHWSTPEYGEANGDYAYASLGRDGGPLFKLGRIHANTSTELKNYVDKVTAYESNGPGTDWRRLQLLINDCVCSPFDEEFRALTVDLLPYIDPQYAVARVDRCDSDKKKAASMKAATTTALNAGALLTNYIGHAATAVWGGNSVANGTDCQGSFYTKADVDALAASQRPYAMFSVSCYNGGFNRPASTDIGFGESFLFHPAGSVGFIGSSSLHGAQSKRRFNEALFEAFYSRGVRTIGEILFDGWLARLAEAKKSDDEILTSFFVLGDAGLKIQTPLPLAVTAVNAVSQPIGVVVTWPASTASNVAGYIVYRAETDEFGVPLAPFAALNSTPVVPTTFTDFVTVPTTDKRLFAYRVQVVDTGDLKSALGPSALVTVWDSPCNTPTPPPECNPDPTTGGDTNTTDTTDTSTDPTTDTSTDGGTGTDTSTGTDGTGTATDGTDTSTTTTTDGTDTTVVVTDTSSETTVATDTDTDATAGEIDSTTDGTSSTETATSGTTTTGDDDDTTGTTTTGGPTDTTGGSDTTAGSDTTGGTDGTDTGTTGGSDTTGGTTTTGGDTGGTTTGGTDDGKGTGGCRAATTANAGLDPASLLLLGLMGLVLHRRSLRRRGAGAPVAQPWHDPSTDFDERVGE